MKRVFWLGLLWLLSGCGALNDLSWLSGSSGATGAVDWVNRDWPSGGHYEGEMVNGKRHGKGSFLWPDGARYVGEYRHDERTGYGVFSWPDGSRYEGQFVGGKRDGKGTFIWPDGARYAGEYRQGQRHGQGTYYSANKSVVVCQAVPQEESQEWMDGRFLGSTTNSVATLAPPPPLVSPSVLPPPVSPVVAGRSADLTRVSRAAMPADFDSSPPMSSRPASAASVAATASSIGTPGLSGISSAGASAAGASAVPGAAAHTVASGKDRTAPATSRTTRELADIKNLQPPPPSGETWREPHTGISFVRIPGGCFQMGGVRGGLDERPAHPVCVDDFWLGRYEVTRDEWEQIMGAAPRQGPTTVVDRQQPRHQGREPMESVSWHDVQQFISRLDQASGTRFRLPTEAEWEYACRSGGREQLYCGDDKPERVAWFDGNSQGTVHPVGTREPNPYGLYDMSGNVWEWVADWYDPDYFKKSPSHNPPGPTRGDGKVFRGGAWLSGTRYIRANQRYRFPPDRRYNLLGFRLVHTP
ncbi:MAG: SUMF1/EgtB/PvdO family nonheme iron enzyme [Magnetococcus sp. DMHC-1]|nr:SUMF1/EgtB/PvdO family nonheme iron enzyme [Magnetococcales bacterium]